MAIKLLRMRGNTLIEVIVVISVIAVIALLAMPNLRRFSIKSKRAEAVQNVRMIYALEQAYRSDNDRFGQLTEYGKSKCPAVTNEINLDLTDCNKLRYSYYTTTNDATSFEAVAASTEICSDGSPDLVTVNHNKVIAITDCQTFHP